MILRILLRSRSGLRRDPPPDHRRRRCSRRPGARRPHLRHGRGPRARSCHRRSGRLRGRRHRRPADGPRGRRSDEVASRRPCSGAVGGHAARQHRLPRRRGRLHPAVRLRPRELRLPDRCGRGLGARDARLEAGDVQGSPARRCARCHASARAHAPGRGRRGRPRGHLCGDGPVVSRHRASWPLGARAVDPRTGRRRDCDDRRRAGPGRIPSCTARAGGDRCTQESRRQDHLRPRRRPGGDLDRGEGFHPRGPAACPGRHVLVGDDPAP